MVNHFVHTHRAGRHGQGLASWPAGTENRVGGVEASHCHPMTSEARGPMQTGGVVSSLIQLLDARAGPSKLDHVETPCYNDLCLCIGTIVSSEEASFGGRAFARHSISMGWRL